ncbi:MAG TPA: manganese transporter [Cryomorphaceae bacterium]|nr:manganese transporter [Owenweeksia sp.]MBF98525.1 manganese transporter [Owenweeksia sp.]HAD97517.1 manganese transporter [Cryomorphaceae bacterium]
MLACQNTGSPQNTDALAKPRIVCTTGMLGDMVKHLMGDSAEVEVLMGPGVDPHLYKATQGDIQRLSQAQAIVYNGLHLEGKMGSIFEKLKHQKAVIAAGDMVSPQRLINSTDFAGAHDPHIWFDVSIWVEAMSGISRELQKLYPGWANYIIQNEINYRSELEELHNFCITHINKISKDQRVMVTAHDAFKYFGRAYAIKVRGLQGISTTAEYGLQDVTELVNFISDHKIKALFVESSVPKRSIEAVIEGCKSKGHPIKLGGELFSDAMGEAGTPEGTYVGMVRHNVNTTVEALK